MHEVKAVFITLFYAPLRPGTGDISTLLAAFWMILEVRLDEVDERLRSMAMRRHTLFIRGVVVSACSPSLALSQLVQLCRPVAKE
jgi:hypothetical protein